MAIGEALVHSCAAFKTIDGTRLWCKAPFAACSLQLYGEGAAVDFRFVA